VGELLEAVRAHGVEVALASACGAGLVSTADVHDPSVTQPDEVVDGEP